MKTNFRLTNLLFCIYTSKSLNDSSVRLLESASEELARFDTLLDLAPPAFALARRVGVIARCALPDADAQGIAAGRASLVAAAADAWHAGGLNNTLEAWRQRVDDGERRARSGAALTVSWLLGAAADPFPLAPQLEVALRPAQPPRPVLARAVEAWLLLRAAETPGLAGLAELAPALILCAAGHFDRVRLLPFAALDPAGRDAALAAWRAGDLEAAAAPLLAEAATAARGERLVLRAAIDACGDDERLLAPLGRAAITARRALEVLRRTLATSMPALSEWLGCSRPAAADALERLVATGLAVEITGRSRDRIYADARGWRQLGAP